MSQNHDLFQEIPYVCSGKFVLQFIDGCGRVTEARREGHCQLRIRSVLEKGNLHINSSFPLKHGIFARPRGSMDDTDSANSPQAFAKRKLTASGSPLGNDFSRVTVNPEVLCKACGKFVLL
jgi:hypothetical protein